MTVSIIICAVACGLLVDNFLAGSIRWFNTGAVDSGGGALVWYDLAAGIVFAFMMAYFTLRHYYRKVRRKLKG